MPALWGDSSFPPVLGHVLSVANDFTNQGGLLFFVCVSLLLGFVLFCFVFLKLIHVFESNHS